MKIGILTFHCARNIGAQLQAFALLKTLEKLAPPNSVVEFIRYEPKYLIRPYRFLRFVNLQYGLLSVLKQTILHLVFDIPIYLKTRCHYARFQKKYFKLSQKSYSDVSELTSSSYNKIFVGSDQIWNPEITEGKLDSFYTLNFSSKIIQKFSYAASLSVNNISEDCLKLLVKRLESFNKVSVRENTVKKILERISKLKIRTVLDPTLLLNRAEWNSYIAKEPIIKEPYVLVFQARGSKDEILNIVNNYAKANNLAIVDASNFAKRCSKYRMSFVSPIEFLNLVKYADTVFSLSFHGTALSIILEKPFYSINYNDGRDGRVVNLLHELGIETQLCSLDENIVIKPQIDYSLIDSKLDNLRRESLSFLQECLNL